MKGNKETISIDSNKVSNFSDFINKSSNRIDGLVEYSQDSFNVLKKNDIFRNGFNRIERGYSEVRQAINQYKNVLNNYYDDLNLLQKDLISVVNGISIPKSYALNDAVISNNNIKTIELTKNNGSVLETKENIKQELEDTFNKESEILNNINNNNIANKENYDGSTIIQKGEILDNINNNINIIDKKVYDKSSVIQKGEILDNINSDNSINKVEDGINFSMSKGNISSINNGNMSSSSQFDDNYSLNINKNINDLNLNNDNIDEEKDNDYLYDDEFYEEMSDNEDDS